MARMIKLYFQMKSTGDILGQLHKKIKLGRISERKEASGKERIFRVKGNKIMKVKRISVAPTETENQVESGLFLDIVI